VVAEDVDCAECGLRLPCHPLAILPSGDICEDRRCLHAAALDLLEGAIEFGLCREIVGKGKVGGIAQVHESKVDSGLGQLERYTAADAARGARHDSASALQIHSEPPANSADAGRLTQIAAKV